MARPVTPLINEATQYRREYPGPIDIDTVFDTTAERMAYLGNNFRYAGQIVSDLEDGNVYVLSANRGQWNKINNGGGGSSNITLANSVFVAKNGNDSTGTVGRLDLPFLTIGAALAAASAGQTIMVYPGDYELSSSLNLKNGVNFYFLGKGSVSLATASPNNNKPLFTDNGTTISCNIFAPQWTMLARISQQVLVLNAASPSSIKITCNVFASDGDDAPYQGKGNFNLKCEHAYSFQGWTVLYAYGGSLIVTADTIETTDDSAGGAIYIDSCPYVNIAAKKIQSTDGSGNYLVYMSNSNAGDQFYLTAELLKSGFEWAVFTNGDSVNNYIKAQKITANSDCTVTSGGGLLTVSAELIESTDTTHVDGVVHGEGGALIVIGARITKDSDATGNEILTTFSGGNVKLIGCSYNRDKVSALSGAGTISDNTLTDGFITVAASNTPVQLRVGANLICDGTNDEAEINAALAVSDVKLLPGTFNINLDNTIVIPASGRSLTGSGKSTVLKYGSKTTGNKIITCTNDIAGIRLSDFSIDGDNGNADYGMYFIGVGSGQGVTSVPGFDIRNIWITGTKQSGIELRSCQYGTVRNVKMVNTSNASNFYFDGITLHVNAGYAGGCKGIIITDCHFLNCTAGIWCQNSSYCEFNNNYIEGDENNPNGQILIQIEMSSHIKCCGNLLKNSAETGLYAEDTCSNIEFINNTIDTTYAERGITLGDAPNSIVSGNLISNTYKDGMYISPSNVVVNGNNIQNCGIGEDDTYSGILVGDNYCTLTGNIVTSTAVNKHKYGIRATTIIVASSNILLNAATANLSSTNGGSVSSANIAP
jgi:parallel beta-helix repeat protein